MARKPLPTQNVIPAAPAAKKPQLKGWVFILSELLTKFGISGMLAIVVMYVFVVEGSKDQHREFIDKFILLKFGTGQTFYLTFLLVLIIILFLYTKLTHRKEVKLLSDTITELQKEKNTLQAKLLKK